MTLEPFLLEVVVGLASGWLAGFIMKNESGLMADVLLGMGGSIVGSWVVRILGVASGGGWFAMIAVAFVGAAVLIAAHRIAQRTLWPVRA